MRWAMLIVLFVAGTVTGTVVTDDDVYERVRSVSSAATFVTLTGEHIRLIGIAPNDCPDSVQQLAFVLGSPVRIMRHGTANGETRAYVFTDWRNPQASFRLHSGSINLYMILNGYAKRDPNGKNAYAASYKRAEAAAKRMQFGLWSAGGCHVR